MGDRVGDRDRDPEADSDHAADRRERDRLDQELSEDVAGARAEREAHSDLARPLGDRDEHDVHDADPSDHQRDGGDASEERREEPRHALKQRLDLARIADGKVVVSAGDDVAATTQMSVSCSFAWSMRSSESADTMSTPARSLPMMRREKVENGMKTTSSWSMPNAEAPFASSTPMTRQEMSRTRISLPTAV